jgi:ubiquitin C-terminal hydrolase
MGKKKRQSSRRAIQRPKAVSKDRKNSSAETSSQLAIRGITNLGNTCFFNASLQALVASFDLSEWEEMPSLKVYTQFVEVMRILKGSGQKIINPSQLLSALSTKIHQFNNRRQHDSHELILHLISSMSEELEKRDPTSPHVFQTFFNGTLAGIVQCQHCGYRSCSINKFVDISLEIPGSRHLFRYPPPRQVLGATTRMTRSKKKQLEEQGIPPPEEKETESSPLAPPEELTSTEPVEAIQQPELEESESRLAGAEDALEIIEPPDDPHPSESKSSSNISLFDCLRQYTSRELLTVESGEGYSCPRCSECSGETVTNHQKRSASKRLLLLDTPSLLIFHFKRLLPGGKCASSISFPLQCSLASFLGTRSSSSPSHADSPSPSPCYQLRAVIVHIGSGGGGHYVAYTYRLGQWFFTSDAATRRASEAEVLESQAYLLMYRRGESDADPSPSDQQELMEAVADNMTCLTVAEEPEGTDGEEESDSEGESEGTVARVECER